MKCESCGGNMGLEDLKCPYCGTPNPFARKHQEEMRRFEKEFAQTRDEVVTSARKTAGRNISIILILVLLLLDMGGFAFASMSSDIAYDMREKKILQEADLHSANLQAYLEDGDYSGFAAYYSCNHLYSLYDVDGVEEYGAVLRAASCYKWLTQDLGYKVQGGSYRFKEYGLSTTCSEMASQITKLWSIEDEFQYKKELYLAPDKMVYIEDMRSRTALLLEIYGGLTKAEIRDLPDMSQSRIQKLLEERLVSADE